MGARPYQEQLGILRRMRVKRDFDEIYASEDDPWGIGDADSERYDGYVELILERSHRRGSVLELGCGFGALLARLRGGFDRLVGLDVSADAVARGAGRFPFIEFVHGTLADPAAALPQAGRFDTIIVSDVLYYLPERDRRTAMAWIAAHLAEDGLAFIAGWSPGGRYLTPDEFRTLVDRELAIESEQILETGHVVLCARPRRALAALTVDYETWQPQLPGVPLDWETDALVPTRRLLDVFDAAGATLTIFAEMGEYLWLVDHRPAIAEAMAEQWRDAVRRGHDVQLHLHPNWLPEMGPSERDGCWSWDMERSRAADYPGDLTAAIGRCKAALEDAIRPVDPSYAVVAYRAGTYEAQPFDRLYDALAANGIWCDSSVLPGDQRPDRHYAYRDAHSDHQPWYAGRFDPQLMAPPSERAIVELPVFAFAPGQRWTFDADEGSRFAQRLAEFRRRERRRRPPSEVARARVRVRGLFNRRPRLRPVGRALSGALPPAVTAALGDHPEALAGHDYFVLVAHTKLELDLDAIARGLRELRESGVEVVSLAGLARAARGELESALGDAPGGAALRTTRAASSPVAPRGRDSVVRRLVPADRRLVVEVTDAASLAALGEMPAGGSAPDCVVADGLLERVGDPQAALQEIHAGLAEGGCLVATAPAIRRGRGTARGDHQWRSTPGEITSRLAAAGFTGPAVSHRHGSGPDPFPPSGTGALHVRAWKAADGYDALARVRELTRWAYHALDPSRSQDSNDPAQILAAGYAWCWGYVLVLGEALVREGFGVQWVTMVAKDHPAGIGPERRDSHEVLQVTLPDGRRVVCDPMAGVVIEASLDALLADPRLADTPRDEDDRYRERRYALYSTSVWYRCTVEVAVRDRPGARLRLRPVTPAA